MHRSKRTPVLLGCISALFYLVAAHSAYPGSWQNGQSLGGFNSVDVYTPDSDSPIGPPGTRSLLIVLHGCVQPISSYSNANLEDAAEAYGMVIAVPDAVHKEGFSCWAYWRDSTTGTPSRTNNDYENLIQLAQEMSSDSSRHIDSDQVYIAGLSSGAAFAHTTACLAPDIFAGVGVSAGPSIGTTSGGALGGCETADVESRCASYAGSYANHFATQISSIAQADDDSTVSTCYNTQNSNGMAELYGVQELPGNNVITEGSGMATETLWEDGRVSMLWFNGGVGHAWSGGAGASGAYISAASINYATYLGDYFSRHNRRVDRNQLPVVDRLILTATDSVIAIEVEASDADGTVVSAEAVVTDAAAGLVVASPPLSDTGAVHSTFTGETGSLADGLYQVAVVVRDDQGTASEAATESLRIGPEPVATAPVLGDISVAVSGRCATVTGTVVDQDLDLGSVVVTFASGDVEATVTGANYSAEACGLPGGSNSAAVTATDLSGLADEDAIAFAIDAGQSATIFGHIFAQRLGYTNYADCYLEYGFATFELVETLVDAQQNTCRWEDDDASCRGPLRICSN